MLSLSLLLTLNLLLHQGVLLLTASSYPVKLQKIINVQRFSSIASNDFKRTGVMDTRLMKNFSSRLLATCEGAPTGTYSLIPLFIHSFTY